MKVADERDALLGKSIEVRSESTRSRDDTKMSIALSQLKLKDRKVVEMAHILYHMFEGNDTIAITASIYAACRIVGVYRPVEAICEAGGVGKKEMMWGYRQIKEKAKEWDNIEGAGAPFTPQQALDYLSERLGEISECTPEKNCLIAEKARNIIRLLQERGVGCGTKSPCMVAAASLYISAPFFGCRYTQREIAKAIDPNLSSCYCYYCGSEYLHGIRTTYRWICDELEIDFEVRGNQIYIEGEKI